MSDGSSVDSDRTMVMTVGMLAGQVPPPEAREHFLVLVEGWQPGLRLPLKPQALKIGRHATCDLTIPDSQVSGQHCEVSAPPYMLELLVVDLNSTNGTYIEGQRVAGRGKLPHGGLLRIGEQVFRHEYLLKSEADKVREHERDLEKARHYVQALLPPPLRSGPLHTDWHYQPSAQLGGDAFGYHQLSEHVFAVYLMDVSGHGVGPAMHSVTVMNLMRQRALPQVDFHEPAQVLRSLNEMFQMDSHDGMYFSIWYGVYDLRSRVLRYASAGHHASYLAGPGRGPLQALKTRNLVIGAMPGAAFHGAEATVPPGSMLYIFSDGVFEVATRSGGQWALPDFLPLLEGPAAPAGQEAGRLYEAVRAVAKPGPLDDDFSLLVVTFL
ncbi:hypothetical protein GCM10027034_19380 [Ramlibacter solisilvae]|uniref:SpoIIE family protein phosphatase n=1 Tax=Ramlibacter tataouinensis TaxID=94132 RepID=UPI000776E691|nr:SpoIIE family protein phosphatase [Ramlibacter tataouinensis]